MEETYPWRKQFEKRVAEVRKRCVTVRSLVAAVLANLQAPPDDAGGGLDLIARLEHDLSDASDGLVVATAWMGAVELLALRSGGHAPAAPLRSIDDLVRGEDGLALRLALTKLRDARARAEDALGGVDGCRGHLGAAKLLLEHPGVPDLEGCIEAERVAAFDALTAAMRQVAEAAALVDAAREVLAVN
ncbi:hypothetical protein ACP70R_030517 [Stipagrostis hirtigluma subsp. patula]